MGKKIAAEKRFLVGRARAEHDFLALSVTETQVTPSKMNRETGSLNRDDWIHYPVRLLSLEGACQYLSCSGDLLEELIALGDVPVIRLGREPRGKRDRRKRWIDRLDLDRFIDMRKEKPAR